MDDILTYSNLYSFLFSIYGNWRITTSDWMDHYFDYYRQYGLHLIGMHAQG